MSEKASKKETKISKKQNKPTSKKIDTRKQILFKQIGAKIAYYRTLRDMSQEELAKKPISAKARSRVLSGDAIMKMYRHHCSSTYRTACRLTLRFSLLSTMWKSVCGGIRCRGSKRENQVSSLEARFFVIFLLCILRGHHFLKFS